MSSGDVAMREILARVRKVEGLVEQAAPEVAATLNDCLQEQIAAGVDPQGTAWQRTQKGTQPLQHAGRVLAIAHVGTRIIARLRGPEARHSRGIARGGIERRILPKAGFAKGVAERIKDTLTREFQLATGGGRG